MIRSIKDVEADIRTINHVSTNEEIKTVLLEMLALIPEWDFPSYKEHELLAERVANIETCLDKSKINTEDLRL